MRLGTRFDRLKESIGGMLSSTCAPGLRHTTEDGENFEPRRVSLKPSCPDHSRCNPTRSALTSESGPVTASRGQARFDSTAASPRDRHECQPRENCRERPRYRSLYAGRSRALFAPLPATLRSWVLGRDYPTAEGGGAFPPLIRPASKRPPLLSFPNLIEAHILRSLRTEHGVPVKALRDALAYAQKTLGIDRLLLRPELRATAGKVFLDRYGELIDLSASGQLAMRQLPQ